MTILPIELWIKVLQHLYEDEGRSTDYESLMSCPLVCSSWREHAQRCLFHSVGRDIYRYSDTRVSFEAAIHPSTERGNLKVLGSYVRVNLDRIFNFTDGTLDMRGFTLLLSWCPRLYELSLYVFDILRFNEVEMAELQFIANTVKLRALRLLRFGIQCTIAYQLISVWPTIQYFTAGSGIATPPPLPLSIRLRELNFCRTSMRPRCLEWFLSGSETSLRILKFRDTPGQLMKRFLAKHTPYLKSLRMQRYDKDSADILRLCTRLEELVLFQLPIFIEVNDLPLTIEHFSFYFRATTCHPLIALVTTLPNLQAIKCDKDVEQYPDFAAIRSVCDAKHVQLKVHSSFYHD